MAKQPPNINGIATLTPAQTATIRTSLQSIQAAFVATDAQPVCDTFYIVSTYNKSHLGAEINGDTAESVLAGV